MLISQFEGMDIYLVECSAKYCIKAVVGSYYMLYDRKGTLLDFNTQFSKIQYLAVEAWIADKEEDIKRNIELLKKNKPIKMIPPLLL